MAEVKGSRMPDPKDYPSNSKVTPSKEKKEHNRVSSVVKDGVSEKKPSVGQKFLKLFFSEDTEDIKRYVIEDLIVPGIKYGILDTLGRIFFNQPGGYRPQTYTNYSRVSSSSTRTSYTPPTQKARATYFADDGEISGVLRPIIFTSRADAERVLQILDEQIRMYDEATVMQYYDACGLTSRFTDDTWGWTSLLGVRVISVRGGYMLNLSKPMNLEAPF